MTVERLCDRRVTVANTAVGGGALPGGRQYPGIRKTSKYFLLLSKLILLVTSMKSMSEISKRHAKAACDDPALPEPWQIALNLIRASPGFDQTDHALTDNTYRDYYMRFSVSDRDIVYLLASCLSSHLE
jgi:hypothetical protein